MTFFPSQEVRIVGKLVKDIFENKIQLIHIDEINRYVLTEFATATIPTLTESLFFELQNFQVTSIIVHLERDHAILTNPK